MLPFLVKDRQGKGVQHIHWPVDRSASNNKKKWTLSSSHNVADS